MNFKTLLLTAAAACHVVGPPPLRRIGITNATVTVDGRPDHSWAERHDRDGNRDARRDDSHRDDWRGRQAWHWRDDRGGWHGDRDRYWREGNRGYRSGDIYYRNLRAHGYSRWDGAPYWYQGRYVVRSYDRFGRVVFVEMNPTPAASSARSASNS